MATITGFTAERMLVIENETVVDGEVRGDNLILITRGGTEIDAGSVRGPTGPTGPPIADGDKGDILVTTGGTVWNLKSDIVSNADLANMAANRIKGAVAAGDPVDLTPLQVVNMLPSATETDKGVVPITPALPSTHSYSFLRADTSTWRPAPPIFVSKASLDSLWPGAPRGASATTSDSDSRWFKESGGWFCREPKFCWGLWNGNTDGNAYARIQFPFSYAGIGTGDNGNQPNVGVACIQARGAGDIFAVPGTHHSLGAFNATNALIKVFNAAGTAQPNAYCVFHWLAWGPQYNGQLGS